MKDEGPNAPGAEDVGATNAHGLDVPGASGTILDGLRFGPLQGVTHPATAEIDPALLTEIGHLALRARFLAESVMTGLHRSRNKGTSVEFAEHKEYSPGDNVRHLDWRALARNDRDYIKQFEDESNLRALMLVDTSGSMGYPNDGSRMSKLSYATTCAGALAYVLARQGDAVGVASFDGKLTIRVPAQARRGHLREVLNVLEGLVPEGPSRLGAAVDALSEALPSKTVVAVFSDLLDGGLDAIASMRRLRSRKNDVVLFHVLDRDELEFPFEESTRFVSMEDDRQVEVDARAIRDTYLAEMERFRESASRSCKTARVEYRLARTDSEPGALLTSFLADRTRLRARAR